MRRVLWSAVVVALAAVAAGAADDKPKAAKSVAELQKEAEDLQRETFKKYEALTEEEKKGGKKVEELFDALEKEQAKLYEAAFELAKADPKADTAAEAVDWLLGTPRVLYLPMGEKVLEFATAHLAASPKIGHAVLTLGRFGPREKDANHKAAAAFVKAVGEKNKDKTVLGQLAMAKGWQAKGKFEAAEYEKANDQDELAAAADKVLEAAAKEFGEVKLLRRGETQTIAEVVKAELFELRNLRVGKPVPDIEGEDLDGSKFKLSDYKGKVVVLDFWGDW
jgi:hypothetical protein